MLHRASPLCLALVMAAAPVVAQRDASDPCRSTRSHLPSADLYCLELVGVPAAPASVTGYAILDLAPGPFTLASDRHGVIRYRPRLVLSGLPSPGSMQAGATAFVAWVTTPRFDTWERLAVVRNGVTVAPAITNRLAGDCHAATPSARAASPIEWT